MVPGIVHILSHELLKQPYKLVIMAPTLQMEKSEKEVIL